MVVQACHKYWKLMRGRLQKWLIKHLKGMHSFIHIRYNLMMLGLDVTV